MSWDKKTKSEFLRRSLVPIAIVWATVTCLVSHGLAGEDSQPVRTAVEKAIPFLWKEGDAWIEKRGCVSCHQIPFMIWALESASRAGFAIDKSRLQEVQQWSLQLKNFTNPKNDAPQTDEQIAAANVDTLSFLLLAGFIDESSNNDEDIQQKFSNSLIDSRQEDGRWKACGQLPLQKRPKSETADVTTIWTLLALLTGNTEFPLTVSINDTLKTLLAQGVSTEWWGARLLLANELAEAEQVAAFRQKLIAFQREDGGWGWLTDAESDAFATGVAMYALKRVGGSESKNALKAAEDFLIRTQQPDGSWHVRSTKAKNHKAVTATATYWGTAWAIIGLLQNELHDAESAAEADSGNR